VPAVTWAILFFDVAMAMLRRRLTGQSLYASDRAHLHHVLQQRGFSVPGVVGIIGLLCLLCCLGVLLGVWFDSELLTLGIGVAVLAILVGSGLFGASEVRLFVQRLCHFAHSLVRLSHPRQTGCSQPVVSRLHGVRAWEDLWSELVTYSERFDVYTVQLNVSAPALGEEYHAQWTRRTSPDMRSVWRFETPLVVGTMAVGRLTLSGKIDEAATIDGMTDLVQGLKPFQIQMEAMLQPTAKDDGPAARRISPRSAPLPSAPRSLHRPRFNSTADVANVDTVAIPLAQTLLRRPAASPTSDPDSLHGDAEMCRSVPDGSTSR